MPDVLFIKTSSLGDVIHHMPAVVDARKARPQTAFAWLVEEAFAPLVRLHPAVSHVIPVAWRRWRKSLYAPSTMSEIAASLRAVRDLHFDDIVDTQGLLRSALIARAARGGANTAAIMKSKAKVNRMTLMLPRARGKMRRDGRRQKESGTPSSA